MAVAKIRRRREQRGAALFLVVLVITLITAVGVYSMRSASLVNVAAGFNRQSVQSAMLARLAARAAATYANENAAAVTNRAGVTGCARMYAEEGTSDFCSVIKGSLLKKYLQQPGRDGLVGQLSATDGTGTGLTASVVAEITGTSAGYVSSNVGSAVGTASSAKVTVTGKAQVFPFNDPGGTLATPNACAAVAGRAIVQQNVRAHVTVPL